MAAGQFGTGFVPTDILRTQVILEQMTARHNNEKVSFRSKVAETTKQSTVEVDQVGMHLQQLGDDVQYPDRSHIDKQTITLSEPTRWGVAWEATRTSIARGMTSERILENHRDALFAVEKWQIKMCLRAMLLDGAWWDATAAPPPFASDTFANTHDHYLAANVAGVPALSHFTLAKAHIEEHGFGGDGDTLVCFMHGQQAMYIENKAEWTNNYTPTPVLDELQQYGLLPAFEAAGVPVIKHNFIPQGYMLFCCLGRRFLRWRIPEGSEFVDQVEVYDIASDSQIVMGREYIIWGAANVVLRSAGVAYYLAAANWTNPTITLAAI